MNTSPTLPVSQSQEQITFDVSPPFFKDGCSLNPSTYNPSADQVNYWQENSGNIMELYGNGFPTTCNPSPLEDIYYSLSGFITLINGNSVLIKPGGFLHQVTGDSSVTWNLDMKFESSSGTVYTFTNLKGIVGSNGLMNITSGTTSNGYGEFKLPTNEGTVQFTNLEDDAGNVFTTYDDAIKLANYDPTTGTSTDYVICSNIALTEQQQQLEFLLEQNQQQLEQNQQQLEALDQQQQSLTEQQQQQLQELEQIKKQLEQQQQVLLQQLFTP